MSSDSEKKGGSKAMMAFGMFLIIVLFVLVTWAILAQSGCTPKHDGWFGSYCNPFPFGEGGSCGGSNGGNGGTKWYKCSDKCATAQSTGSVDSGDYETQSRCCSGCEPAAGWADTDPCKSSEGYRRFNRSPRRREGYRRFARR